MYLVISSQDIKNLTLALSDGKDLTVSEEFFVPPERHLVSIDQALSKWKVAINGLKGVIVVTGPGSFTASRVSVTIANSIAMTQKIPVWGIENNNELPLKELIVDIDLSKLPSKTFTLPAYNRGPNITLPKK